MKKILYLYIATLLLAMPGVVAQVDGGLTRSGEVSTYDGTRADFLTVSGKLSRYPHLSRAGEELHYAPVVTTDSVHVELLSNAVTVYGNILFNGWYETVTAQGFQLSTTSSFEGSSVTEYPVTPGSPYVECDQPCSANVFTLNITDLTPNIPYYVRAYATNTDGTTYGEALPVIIYSGDGCPGTPTVTDHEGNEYTTVQIGYLCWTRQNMRCTTLPSGRTMTSGYDLAQPFTASGSPLQPYYYNSQLSDSILYRGYLYNWAAAMDTAFTASTSDSYVKRRGICPAGWHVPSMDEWDYMLGYVMTHNFGCDGDNTKITKALSYDTTSWYNSSSSCTPGNDPSTNNLTEFSAYPANYYQGSGVNVLHLTDAEYVRFWSSSTCYNNNNQALYIGWDYSDSQVSENCISKSAGFSVRCVRDFTGLRVPTVRISSIDSVTQETVKVVSEVTNMGGAEEIYQRGICWSLDPLPTIPTSDYYRLFDETGEGLGEFISRIQHLLPGTTYHVRAFAINFEGVGYSDDMTFTTEVPANRCPGTPTVTDHEGNVYNTVQVGYQCWTRENMRCTTSPNGTEIGFGGGDYSDYIRCGDTLALYYNDYASPVPLEQRGYHYNWYAAMDTVSKTASIPYISFEKRRGICPEGWHVPSITEWDTLVNYMSRQSEYMCREDAYSKYFANALASKYWWANASYSDTCYVGVSPENNNASGMSMIPTGYWYSGGFRIEKRSQEASFWSSTLYSNNSSYYYYFRLRYDVNQVYPSTSSGNEISRGNAIPLRCLRDTTGLYVPTVTASVDTVTSVSAMFNASVTNDGGATVTEYGLCYSTNPNPTVNDLKVVSGAGLGDFADTITGLVPNLTYYVRAYARNYEGTGYSEVMEIATPASANSCPGTPTVTDHEGNVYNTVQIGDQCWTRENMRCVTTPNRPNDTLMTTCISWNCKSNYEPHIYSAFNFSGCNADPSMLRSYGYFYNWPAAMDTVGTDDITASFVNRRGICPQGWHVPSAAEWDTLLAYVGRQEDYRCNNNSNYIARTLADQSTWNSYSSNCCPGADLTQNNATGFTAVAVGDVGYNSSYSYVQYNSPGYRTSFWSSTHYTPSNSSDTYFSYYYSLNYSSASVNSSYSGANSDGYSVRCIKDVAGTVEMTNPKVTTIGVSEVAATSAKFTGEVVSDGNATVTERGFCWGYTANNLDTNHTHAACGTGAGVFETTISDFVPGNTYYMRAYAVNSLGITYGDPVSFTMSKDFHVDALPYSTDFSDATSWVLNDNGYEGCYWTIGADNGYCTGTSLFVTQDGTTAGYTNNYGYAYNHWLSAEKFLKMPAGDSVHVEFDVLAGGYTYFHYMKAFLAPTDYSFTSGSSYFNSGYNTNAVNFKKYMSSSSDAYYLSQTSSRTYHVSVNVPNPAPNDTCKLAFLWTKNSYYSGGSQPGAVISNVVVSTVAAATDSVTNVTSSSAKVYGKVTSFGGDVVTEHGVCWATHAQATVSGDSHISVGTGYAAFNVNLTSLDFNTVYYVRTYATTSTGLTVYGDEIQFKTLMSAEGYSTLPYSTDFTDGNKWILNNGDAENYWTIGTPSGESAPMLYITNDSEYPGSVGYATSTSSTVVTAEKPLLMPATADSVYVSFDVNVGGESQYDFIKVFLTPEEFEIPVYFGSIADNSISHKDSSRYAVDFSEYLLMTEETSYPYKLSRTRGNVLHIVCRMANPTPGTHAKLVFLWRNDGSGGTQPGAIISSLAISTEPDRSCPGTPTVTDHEGNVYATVQIGEQCWMRDNLRTTTSPTTGTYLIPAVGTDYTFTGKQARWYNNDSATYAPMNYGLLYNWNAAVDTFNTAYGETSVNTSSGNAVSVSFSGNRRGICPEGWHLPSNAEWTLLIDYVRGQSEYTCDGNIAKALASTEGWNNYAGECYPGDQSVKANNATGFSAVPAGYYSYSSAYQSLLSTNAGKETSFWSSTQLGSSSVHYYSLGYNSANLSLIGDSKINGLSVRCLRD